MEGPRHPSEQRQRRAVESRVINPWTWQDRFGFVQAKEVVGAERTLYCAGQTSVDENGQPVHHGDIEKQAWQALDNPEAVVREAGFELSDIARLNVHLPDIDAYPNAAPAEAAPLGSARVRQSATLLG